jgi:hypothetical protein
VLWADLVIKIQQLLQWLALGWHNKSNDVHQKTGHWISIEHDRQYPLHSLDFGFISSLFELCSELLQGGRVRRVVLRHQAVRGVQVIRHDEVSVPVLVYANVMLGRFVPLGVVGQYNELLEEGRLDGVERRNDRVCLVVHCWREAEGQIACWWWWVQQFTFVSSSRIRFLNVVSIPWGCNVYLPRPPSFVPSQCGTTLIHPCQFLWSSTIDLTLTSPSTSSDIETDSFVKEYHRNTTRSSQAAKLISIPVMATEPSNDPFYLRY